METNQIKSVWVLVYNDLGTDGMRKVYGVYANEDLANDALNDEIFLPLYSGPNPSEAEVNELYDVLDPEITEHIINY